MQLVIDWSPESRARSVLLDQTRRDINLAQHLSWLPTREVSEMADRGKCLMIHKGIDHASRGSCEQVRAL